MEMEEGKRERPLCTPQRFTVGYLLLSLVFTAATLLLLWLGVKGSARLPERQGSAPADAAAEGKPVRVCLVLDAGHGGEDGGAVGVDGLLEKNVNLKIVENLRDLFMLADVPVVLTRSTDRLLYDPTSDYRGHKKTQDLRSRLETLRQTQGGVLLSIHLNSFSQSQYSGLQVYYSKNHPDSVLLAEAIQSSVRATLQPANDRRIKPAGSSIYLLNRSERPAVLVECGFLSNPDECALLGSDAYLGELSAAIFAAVCDYLPQSTVGT